MINPLDESIKILLKEKENFNKIFNKRKQYNLNSDVICVEQSKTINTESERTKVVIREHQTQIDEVLDVVNDSLIDFHIQSEEVKQIIPEQTKQPIKKQNKKPKTEDKFKKDDSIINLL